jgi:hypothetical protein
LPEQTLGVKFRVKSGQVTGVRHGRRGLWVAITNPTSSLAEGHLKGKPDLGVGVRWWATPALPFVTPERPPSGICSPAGGVCSGELPSRPGIRWLVSHLGRGDELGLDLAEELIQGGIHIIVEG